jgi:hypothetical protein
MSEFLQTIDLVKISWAGAFVLVFVMLNSSGLLKAIAEWISSKANGKVGHEERIRKIETNDIQHIEADIKSMRMDINGMRTTQSLHGERLARLEAKVLNGKL